jgi:hypothetical protein
VDIKKALRRENKRNRRLPKVGGNPKSEFEKKETLRKRQEIKIKEELNGSA